MIRHIKRFAPVEDRENKKAAHGRRWFYAQPHRRSFSIHGCCFNSFSEKEKPPITRWFAGTSKGNRTPDFALRGRRLNRLTMEAYMAGELGFEPRMAGSEPDVLPLHHSPMCSPDLADKVYYTVLSCECQQVIFAFFCFSWLRSERSAIHRLKERRAYGSSQTREWKQRRMLR